MIGKCVTAKLSLLFSLEKKQKVQWWIVIDSCIIKFSLSLSELHGHSNSFVKALLCKVTDCLIM